MTSVRSTSNTDARIVCVLSRTICMLIAAGTDALSDGNAAFTRSTVWMMFAPGCRKMTSGMAGLPLR